MKENEIKKILREQIIKSFRLNKKKIFKVLSSNNVENWDSLGHLILIREIEKKFNVSFSPKDIPEALDEKKILTKIKKKIKK